MASQITQQIPEETKEILSPQLIAAPAQPAAPRSGSPIRSRQNLTAPRKVSMEASAIPTPRLAHGGPSPRKGSMPFQECLQRVGKVFKLNIDEQVSQDEQKERCFAAILKACQEKNWEDINHCKRALVQITDQAGRNVLLHILASGERECAIELIKLGIALHATDAEGNTAAHYAARLGDVEMLKDLQAHNYPLFTQNRRGETPLHAAIGASQVEVVKALLKGGGDFNALFTYENILRLTPVAYAAIRGEVECMHELLKAGANLEIPENPIGNLLHLIVYFQQNEVLLALLKHHLSLAKPFFEKIDAKNGRTPLLLACRINNPQAVIILNFYGAVLEARDLRKRTPMHYAGMQRNPYLLEVLFYLGCDHAAQDKDRNFPIDFVTDEDALGREVRGLFQLMMMLQRKRGDKIPDLFREPVTNLLFRCDSFPAISSLGALKSLNKTNDLEHLSRVGGSSWGAVIATLTAFGYTVAELTLLFQKTDKDLFLDPLEENQEFLQKALASLEGEFTTKKEKEWIALLKIGFGQGLRSGDSWHLLKIAHLFKECQGLCQGEKFRRWIEFLIADKIKNMTGVEISYCTFGQLRELREKFPALKHLHLFTGKGGNSREVFRFSSEDSACDHLIISDVVRACLDRGQYVPHVLHEKAMGMRKACSDLGEFSDCVMVYASPVEAFDKKKCLVEDVAEAERDYPAFNPQTLLVEVRLAGEEEKRAGHLVPKNISDLLFGIGRVYQHMAKLSRQVSPFNRHRVIEIDVDPNEDPEQLFSLGERVARDFIESHGERMETSHELHHFTRLMMNLRGILSLPASHPHFIGRTDLLEELKKKIFPAGSSSKKSGVFVLHGREGNGKTEAAITFGNQNLHEFSFVWTISCATPQERMSDYLLLARALKIPIVGEFEEGVVEKVHRVLEENMEKPWLLIMLNLNSHTTSFPKRGGIVLATSLEPNANPDVANMEVLPFRQQEDFSMLMTGRRQDFSGWVTMTRWSGGSPLIVDLISCGLRVQKKTLQEFEALLAPKLRYHYTEMAPDIVLDLIIGLSLKTLPSSTVEWLFTCAFLNGARIPWEYLENWSPSLRPSERNQIKRTLEDLALLRYDPLRNTFSMHLSVQEALVKLSPPNMDVRALGLVETMGQQWDLEDPEDPLKEEQRAAVWMEHAYKVSSYPFSGNLKKALFLKKMGSWEEEHGNFAQSLRFYKQALPDLEKELEPENDELLETWEHMGFCYLAIENWKEALKFLMKSVQSSPRSESVHDSNEPSTLHNIGVCHLKQGKPQVAMSYFSRALAILREESGDDNIEAAKCLDNMGNCHLETEQFDEAAKKKEEALPILKRHLGEDHPLIVKVLETLTQCYVMLGEDQKAALRLKEAYDIVARTFDAHSPEAVRLHKALDDLRSSQGERDKCLIQ